jgi:hypothetical protein
MPVQPMLRRLSTVYQRFMDTTVARVARLAMAMQVDTMVSVLQDVIKLPAAVS